MFSRLQNFPNLAFEKVQPSFRPSRPAGRGDGRGPNSPLTTICLERNPSDRRVPGLSQIASWPEHEGSLGEYMGSSQLRQRARTNETVATWHGRRLPREYA